MIFRSILPQFGGILVQISPNFVNERFYWNLPDSEGNHVEQQERGVACKKWKWKTKWEVTVLSGIICIYWLIQDNIDQRILLQLCGWTLKHSWGEMIHSIIQLFIILNFFLLYLLFYGCIWYWTIILIAIQMVWSIDLFQ